MNKEKQELYLSEVFLEMLNGDFSLEAVLKALKKCDDEVRQKSSVSGCVSRVIERLLKMFGLKREVPQNMQQEFFDFWDVYGEFDSMLTPGMKKKYFIFDL